MQVVRGSCPTCGPVEMKPADITVTVNEMSAEGAAYTFSCPECGDNVTKPASTEVQRLFCMATGVRWNVVHVPAELDEAHYVGPALTESDVADFMIDLGLTPAHLLSILAGGDE